VLADGGACPLNALAPKVFRGEGPSSYSRPGRIPGSVNVPSASLLDPQTGRFRTPEQLSEAFAAGNVESDAGPLIAYCGGGISATVDLFALSLLGREGRLYDGSLTEWTADPSLPVQTG
jgi:thiosulfate/3-mercaptopyruvate sulfurtransferase